MKYGLSEKQFDEVIKVISGFKEIEEAVLFGSRALGSFKEASDIDIALKGSKADHNAASSLKSRFEDETDLPFFFDVVSYSDIVHPKLKEHIDRYGTTVYRKNWRTVKLGDIATLTGGGTPKTSAPEYWNGDIPWLSVTDFNTGKKYVYDSEKSITKSGLKNSNANILKKGEIIISARGTVGVIAIAGREMAFNQSCYGVKAKDESFNEYIYYLIKNMASKLRHISHGAVFDTFTRNTFNNIECSLPPLHEQKSIAEVLSGLDDKIDLLQRQNKTLEDTAQALFRQWFIKEARPDWKTASLDEIAHYLNGLACQKHPPKNEIDKLPVLKIKELKNGLAENSDWADSKSANKYIVKLGDIIFSWSGSLMIKIWHGPKCILNQHLFKVTSKNYPKWFYYFWTKYYMEKFISIAESKATTMGHIQRKHLSNAKILVPSQKELLKMNNEIEPLFERLILNLKSVLELEKLRETLLPKLISGSVRLKPASNEK